MTPTMSKRTDTLFPTTTTTPGTTARTIQDFTSWTRRNSRTNDASNLDEFELFNDDLDEDHDSDDNSDADETHTSNCIEDEDTLHDDLDCDVRQT